MPQVSKRHAKKLVYFIADDTLTESICDNLAATLNYRPIKADCITDVIAFNSAATLIHRECLDSILYDFLRDVYLTPVPQEARDLDPDIDWDLEFDEKYIVFGEGPEIPEDMKPFFIETGRINFTTLLNLIKE